MSGPLASAQELALVMSQRWGVEPGPRVVGGPQEISALMLHAQPGEVWSEPGDAHILSYVMKGEPRHRYWRDGRLAQDGPLPSRSLNIVLAGVSPRAIMSQPIRLLHVYLPHLDLADRAAQAGWGHGAGALEVICPRYAPDPLLEGLCAMLACSLPASLAQDRLLTEGLTGAIAARVLQRWSNLRGQPVSQPPRGGLAPWQLRQVCDYMQQHLPADVSLADLAAVAGLSTAHFCRAFRQSAGMPPFQWRLARRMDRACELLERTDMPVTEIAAAVGYDNPGQFATAFRRAVGCTPSHYRRERRT